MIMLTDKDVKAIREIITFVWETGYTDKTMTLIESMSALSAIETLLDTVERYQKQKPEHEAQAIA